MLLAAVGGREDTRSFADAGAGAGLAGATALILVVAFGGAEERVFALARPVLAPARFTPAFSIALPCFPDFTNDRSSTEGRRNAKTSEIALSLSPALTPFDGVVKFFDIAKRG
jgi:hypothetical protein